MIKRWQLKRNIVKLSTTMPDGYFIPARRRSTLAYRSSTQSEQDLKPALS
jgi:hypothetical protein